MSGHRKDRISAHVRSGRNSHSRPEVPEVARAPLTAPPLLPSCTRPPAGGHQPPFMYALRLREGSVDQAAMVEELRSSRVDAVVLDTPVMQVRTYVRVRVCGGGEGGGEGA
jgi:hypothetical protein